MPSQDNFIRLTTAQAIIKFLKNQYVERDGIKHKFFAGCMGIFGHGNLALGQALQENPDFKFLQGKNEQGMVHTAAAYAKMKNRLGAFCCTASIGPGATNMLTGAALATINRLPVLLLPGDIFSSRKVAPVLQQLEFENSQDVSVNNCFAAVSKYWDRINRPEQIITSLMNAMQILVSASQTGAVTIALPQDVQVQAFDYPVNFFKERTWPVLRPKADNTMLGKAIKWILESKSAMIIAGGGVIYSEAEAALAKFVNQTGIPVAETQAGKGSLHYDDVGCLGGMGVSGTKAANLIAQSADLIIGIGTRYSDFTTASKTAFQNPAVKFINININSMDAYKHSGLPLVADAKETIEYISKKLELFRVKEAYTLTIKNHREEWNKEVDRIYNLNHSPLMSQGEVIGVLNSFTDATDVIVCAAGSLPGDLHKLWRTRDSKGYHLEYGYSCMGYEIAGGLGVKIASPQREVYVLVGDASYLMMAQEIVTSIQENIKLIIILFNNHGYASINSLSKSLGSEGFGTTFKYRGAEGNLNGKNLSIDFAANAKSLGAYVISVDKKAGLIKALESAKKQKITTLVEVEVDFDQRVGGYESWWDVPIAEVSTMPAVITARNNYTDKLFKESYFL